MATAELLPIFFMHGIGDNHGEFDGMRASISTIDPTVVMYSLPVCDDSASYANLWDQGQEVMDRMREQIQAHPDVYKNGYALLCHSQGALTCRTVVQRMDDHKIHTLIALAGPQMGEFGIPSGWQGKIPWGRDLAYPAFYSSTFQKDLSIANFWHDPRPTSNIWGKPATDYLVGNTFLPVLNNNPGRRTQGPGKGKDDSEAARYKANLLRLKKAVFTCGTADDMIIPYDSGIWNFYDQHAEQSVLLEQTPLWEEDWLGLRELNDTERLVRITADGVCHTCWAHDGNVFSKYIKPYLPIVAETDVIV
jgi:palmitoyl-protein thioesterase